MYKVGFVDTKYINLNETYGYDINKELNAEAFMSVEDYDLLWGEK